MHVCMSLQGQRQRALAQRGSALLRSTNWSRATNRLTMSRLSSRLSAAVLGEDVDCVCCACVVVGVPSACVVFGCVLQPLLIYTYTLQWQCLV